MSSTTPSRLVASFSVLRLSRHSPSSVAGGSGVGSGPSTTRSTNASARRRFPAWRPTGQTRSPSSLRLPLPVDSLPFVLFRSLSLTAARTRPTRVRRLSLALVRRVFAHRINACLAAALTASSLLIRRLSLPRPRDLLSLPSIRARCVILLANPAPSARMFAGGSILIILDCAHSPLALLLPEPNAVPTRTYTVRPPPVPRLRASCPCTTTRLHLNSRQMEPTLAALASAS